MARPATHIEWLARGFARTAHAARPGRALEKRKLSCHERGVQTSTVHTEQHVPQTSPVHIDKAKGKNNAKRPWKHDPETCCEFAWKLDSNPAYLLGLIIAKSLVSQPSDFDAKRDVRPVNHIPIAISRSGLHADKYRDLMARIAKAVPPFDLLTKPPRIKIWKGNPVSLRDPWLAVIPSTSPMQDSLPDLGSVLEDPTTGLEQNQVGHGLTKTWFQEVQIGPRLSTVDDARALVARATAEWEQSAKSVGLRVIALCVRIKQRRKATDWIEWPLVGDSNTKKHLPNRLMEQPRDEHITPGPSQELDDSILAHVDTRIDVLGTGQERPGQPSERDEESKVTNPQLESDEAENTFAVLATKHVTESPPVLAETPSTVQALENAEGEMHTRGHLSTKAPRNYQGAEDGQNVKTEPQIDDDRKKKKFSVHFAQNSEESPAEIERISADMGMPHKLDVSTEPTEGEAGSWLGELLPKGMSPAASTSKIPQHNEPAQSESSNAETTAPIPMVELAKQKNETEVEKIELKKAKISETQLDGVVNDNNILVEYPIERAREATPVAYQETQVEKSCQNSNRKKSKDKKRRKETEAAQNAQLDDVGENVDVQEALAESGLGRAVYEDTKQPTLVNGPGKEERSADGLMKLLSKKNSKNSKKKLKTPEPPKQRSVESLLSENPNQSVPTTSSQIDLQDPTGVEDPSAVIDTLPADPSRFPKHIQRASTNVLTRSMFSSSTEAVDKSASTVDKSLQWLQSYPEQESLRMEKSVHKSLEQAAKSANAMKEAMRLLVLPVATAGKKIERRMLPLRAASDSAKGRPSTALTLNERSKSTQLVISAGNAMPVPFLEWDPVLKDCVLVKGHMQELSEKAVAEIEKAQETIRATLESMPVISESKEEPASVGTIQLISWDGVQGKFVRSQAMFNGAISTLPLLHQIVRKTVSKLNAGLPSRIPSTEGQTRSPSDDETSVPLQEMQRLKAKLEASESRVKQLEQAASSPYVRDLISNEVALSLKRIEELTAKLEASQTRVEELREASLSTKLEGLEAKLEANEARVKELKEIVSLPHVPDQDGKATLRNTSDEHENDAAGFDHRVEHKDEALIKPDLQASSSIRSARADTERNAEDQQTLPNTLFTQRDVGSGPTADLPSEDLVNRFEESLIEISQYKDYVPKITFVEASFLSNVMEDFIKRAILARRLARKLSRRAEVRSHPNLQSMVSKDEARELHFLTRSLERRGGDPFEPPDEPERGAFAMHYRYNANMGGFVPREKLLDENLRAADTESNSASNHHDSDERAVQHVNEAYRNSSLGEESIQGVDNSKNARKWAGLLKEIDKQVSDFPNKSTDEIFEDLKSPVAHPASAIFEKTVRRIDPEERAERRQKYARGMEASRGVGSRQEDHAGNKDRDKIAAFIDKGPKRNVAASMESALKQEHGNAWQQTKDRPQNRNENSFRNSGVVQSSPGQVSDRWTVNVQSDFQNVQHSVSGGFRRWTPPQNEEDTIALDPVTEASEEKKTEREEEKKRAREDKKTAKEEKKKMQEEKRRERKKERVKRKQELAIERLNDKPGRELGRYEKKMKLLLKKEKRLAKSLVKQELWMKKKTEEIRKRKGWEEGGTERTENMHVQTEKELALAKGLRREKLPISYARI